MKIVFNYNTRTLFIYIMLLFFLLQPKKTIAQEKSTTTLPKTWSLNDCFEYAFKNNTTINTLKLANKITTQNVLLAEASKLPNLNGSATETYSNSKTFNSNINGLQSQSVTTGNYALNSSVLLIGGNQLNNAIKQNKALEQASKYNIEASQNNLTLQITQAYLAILLAKENTVYLQQIIETSKAQYDLGQLKFNAGSIAKKDAIVLKAQLATDNYNLVLSQSLERQNTLNLKQFLLLPSDVPFEIQNTTTANTVIKSFSDLKDTQEIALKERPEIKSSELQIEASDLQLKQNRANYYPSLSATGTIGSGYSNPQNTDYFNQISDAFYQRVGLSLAIPILNNRMNKTNVEKSKIAIDQAKINLQGTQFQLSQEIEQAYLNVVNAQNQYAAAQEQYDSNAESYRISNEQLKLGGITTVDYLVQKNLYIQSFQNFLQAKYNAIVNLKIYEFYKGSPINLD